MRKGDLFAALILAAALFLAAAGCGAQRSEPATVTPAVIQSETPSPAAPTPAAPKPENIDAPADWDPDFRFSTVDSEGNAWSDARFAESRLTMINLWAYWCGPCVGELPALQSLSENYADRGFRLLGISDAAYEKDNERAAADAGVTYPRLRYTAEFDDFMNTGYIPTTIFVEENGRVVGEAYVGSRSYDEWAAIVEELLESLS